MHLLQQRLVKLQRRLAAGEDDVGRRGVGLQPARATLRLGWSYATCQSGQAGSLTPLLRNRPRQVARPGEMPAAGAIHADKIGVAELANGLLAVLFAAGPQIA